MLYMLKELFRKTDGIADLLNKVTIKRFAEEQKQCGGQSWDAVWNLLRCTFSYKDEKNVSFVTSRERE